jgi:LPXTG-site transpeptidase (sortase) family protein
MTTENKQIKRVTAFIVIVGILACIGLIFVGYKMLTKEGVIVAPIAVGAGSENPDVAKEASDETPVATNTLESYKVAPDEPRLLKIEALKIQARIRPMGVNSIGAVQAPINIYDSGWYTNSTKPGGIGAVFIDGHASGATRKGLFAYLDTLKNGNTVSIERGDGEVYNYKVVHVETVSKDTVDMDDALRPYGDAKEGLNLMTCTGKWIEAEKTYDKRVIVYTERVS